MRIALLISIATLSTTTLGAPIGETHYRLEAVRSLWSGTRSFADGEHLIRLGTIFQRVGLHPYAEQPFELLEIGLPMSEGKAAVPYAGELRVLEKEGTLWTPEGDARVVLTDNMTTQWLNLATAGDFLVCGGGGARFATLRTNDGGDLEIIELEQHPTNSPWIMAGDPTGGIYYAFLGALKTARVDSTGHLILMSNSYGRDNREVETSPASNHLYASDYDGLQLYRIESPGTLSHLATLLPPIGLGVPVGPIDVWHDPERRIDRVAAVGARDTLFVFEVDETGASSLLFADGDLGSSRSQSFVFLESGRLYYSDGGSLIWLFEGPELEHRKRFLLDQPDIRTVTVATNGDGWATHGGTDGAGWKLSYGTDMRAGFSSPGTVTRFPNASLMAMNDTHLYAGVRREDLITNWRDWYYIFERGDTLALADSVATPFRTFHGYVPWTIERDFLVTANPVFDLSDPSHPALLGTFIDPEWMAVDLLDVAARPFPGSATDLLAAVQTHRDDDTLSFYRVSREQGIERIYEEVNDFANYYAFDDTRDLFYRGELAEELLIWVHEVSDPYHPELIHRYVFDDRIPDGRFFFDFVAQDGILHIGHASGRLGYNHRWMTTPLWFDGERFVPAGKPLHAPLKLGYSNSRSGYLQLANIGDAAALLSFDPPPLPRREEQWMGDR